MVINVKAIKYKKADSTHIKMVYLIRNNPLVRKELICDGDINYLQHIEHYNKMLEDRNYSIYVMYYGSWIIGFYNVIVDRNKKEVEIGYKLSPTFWGKGLGKIMFRDSLSKVKKLYPKYGIILTVFKDNEKAVKIYKSGGFKLSGAKKVRDRLLYTMKLHNLKSNI